jgi:hypothetical protein
MTTTDTTQRRPFPAAVEDGAAARWADPSVDLRPSAVQRWLPLLAWLGTLVVAIGLLLALGGGRLAAPDLTAPGSWSTWAAGRDPLEVTMVVVRLLGLALAWYLVGVTSISVLARLLRAARLVRIADALAVGPVRTIAQQAVGISLAAGVLVAAVPPTAWSDVPPPATETLAPSTATETIAPLPPTGPPSPTLVQGAAPATPIAEEAPAAPVPAPTVAPSAEPTAPRTPQVPDTAGATTPSPPEQEPPSDPASGAAETGTAATTTDDDRVPSAGRTVTVAPGDHFWALASDDLAAHLGRAPSDDEVVVHWEAVVEANRDRLVVTGNADLLLPGQRIVLPPVAGATP